MTSFYGLLGRNLFTSGVMDVIQSCPNLRVVIFTFKEREDFYKKFFPSERIIVEGIGGQKRFKRDKFLGVLFAYLSDQFHWGRNIRNFWKNQQYLNASFLWVLSKLGHLRIVRCLVRWMDYMLMPKNFYKQYFDKYNPDLVFASDVFSAPDVNLLREARYRGVFTLGMVRSWDNITAKGLNRVIPDKTIVHNPVVKEEAIQYNDINPSDIHIVGVPLYDRYINNPKHVSRAEFCQSLSLDPNKKLVVVAPPQQYYIADDPMAFSIVEALKPLRVQVVIRPHMMGKANMGGLRPTPGELAILAPDASGDPAASALSDKRLADLLYHSDLTISFSTLAIDAAVFDTPSIFIGFDVRPKPYDQSVRRWHEVECMIKLRATGGVRLAENLEQLVEQAKRYLNDPKLDQEGRRIIRERYCWKLDGKSGERLGRTILSYL